MKTNYSLPLLQRLNSSVPLLNTSKNSIYNSGRDWSPNQLTFADHRISIDRQTGNLCVSTSDISALPYFSLGLGFSRRYESQKNYRLEHHLASKVNADLRPGFFGNWDFSQEIQIEKIWKQTRFIFQASSGQTFNKYFVDNDVDFLNNSSSEVVARDSLGKYGVPKRVLDDLLWDFQESDFLLRSTRGQFMIFSGDFSVHTKVDNERSRIFILDPVTGKSFAISSAFHFDDYDGNVRMLGHNSVLCKTIDQLGHAVTFAPEGARPYTCYKLFDGNGRAIRFVMGNPIPFLNGSLPGGTSEVSRVTQVIGPSDGLTSNVVDYLYSGRLLSGCDYSPHEIGRVVRYHYTSNVLTAIEDSFGKKISFIYEEDFKDLDETLNPRLKIARILAPTGIEYKFSYDIYNEKSGLEVAKSGAVHHVSEEKFVVDKANTQSRFVTESTIKISRGYYKDAAGTLQVRTPANSQQIIKRTEYSSDDRFNVKSETDSLSRKQSFTYNDFNQVISSTDIVGNVITQTYDNPASPSATNPVHFDLIQKKKKNRIRSLDTSRNITESIVDIISTFEYIKYDAASSPNAGDVVHSTHRVKKRYDEEDPAQFWLYEYHDASNFNSPLPGATVNPLGARIENRVDANGSTILVKDELSNEYLFEIDNYGRIVRFQRPGDKVFDYSYNSRGLLDNFNDEFGNDISIAYDKEGRIDQITDQVIDITRYVYDDAGRLSQLVKPLVGPSGSVDKVWNFETDSFGRNTAIRNPGNFAAFWKYDESSRLFEWGFNASSREKIGYNEVGEMLFKVDAANRETVFQYYPTGFLKRVNFPNWSDDSAVVPGKVVDFAYDLFGHVHTIIDTELGTAQFIYNKINNLTAAVDYNNFVLRVTHDKIHRVTRFQSDDGNVDQQFVLDNLDRVVKSTDSPVLDGSVSWENIFTKTIATVTKVLNLYTSRSPELAIRSEFDYDVGDRLIQKQFFASRPFVGGLLSQDVSYNPDNNVRSVTGDGAAAFAYDSLKRLQLDNTLGKAYDDSGNEMSKSDPATGPALPNTFDTFNRLTFHRNLNAVFKYDTMGNLSERSVSGSVDRKFYFDAVGNLRKADTPTHTISYLYNFDNELYSRTVITKADSSIVSTIFNRFRKQLLVAKDSDGQFRLMTWASEGSISRIRSSSTIASSPSKYKNSVFCVTDALGRILKYCDYDKELASNNYDADGRPMIAPGFEFAWRSDWFDSLVQMYKIGNRWYDPTIHRWISEDPLAGILQNQIPKYMEISNQYVYSLNDPVNRYDPSGLASEPRQITVSPPQMEFYFGQKLRVLGYGVSGDVVVALPAYRGTDLALGFTLGRGPYGVGLRLGVNEKDAYAQLSGNIAAFGVETTYSTKQPQSSKFILKLVEAKTGYYGMAFGADIQFEGTDRGVDLVVNPAFGIWRYTITIPAFKWDDVVLHPAPFVRITPRTILDRLIED